MTKKLTNVRTLLQFTKYSDVYNVVFNGNKLMAYNSIRSQYAVKQFSMIHENVSDCYLIEGTHTIDKL